MTATNLVKGTLLGFIVWTLLIAHWGGAALAAEQDPPFKIPAQQDLLRLRSALIQTSKGNIYVELYPKEAPWHVANFKYLADRGFYRNLKFNIFEPGYLVQTGAPGPKVNSGPGYTLPPEFNNYKHQAGTLSMVRKPNEVDFEHTRRSHGSQFRILMQTAPKMDGYFTVFGQVIKGYPVVEALDQSDYIKDIKVFVAKAPKSVTGGK